MSLRAIIAFLLLSSAGIVEAQDQKPEIACSFSIIEDWCLKTLKGKGLCYSIAPRNSGLHDYQLSAQDVVRLRRSKVVIGFTPESEAWLSDWSHASPRHRVVWLGINPDGSRIPPHGWMDPIHVKTMANRLCTELKRADDGLQVSQGEVIKEAEEVHARLSELFAGLPPDRRSLITQHPSLGPFAQRYGLRVAGTLLTSASGEAADTSARHFSSLLKCIKSERVRVIMADEGHNQDMAERLAADAGLPKPIVLNLESLSTVDGPASTWRDMMLHNGTLLHRALMAP